jgi:HSP20 family protein
MVNIRSPWAFQDLVHELDRLTRDAGWAFGGPSIISDSRSSGLRIEEDEAVLEVDLPGVRNEDLSIELEDQHLKLHAVRSDLHQEEEEVVLRERSYGEFTQTYSLPWAVKEDAVEARFEAGTLQVRIPRAPDTKPRRIEIQSS